MNDSDTKFVLEERLENELDSDDELLNLLVPEANNHVVGNPTVEKTLEEGSNSWEERRKIWEVSKRKKWKKGKGKGRERDTQEEAMEKAKKNKSNLVKLNLIGKNICPICEETI